MSEVVEVLEKARARIEDPERWTQRVAGRDESGRAVPIDKATQVCLDGALCLQFPDEDFRTLGGVPPYKAAVALLEQATDYKNIADFNDTHTHPEVLAAFDRAIELARKDHPHA